jgi:hypothetical protein
MSSAPATQREREFLITSTQRKEEDQEEKNNKLDMLCICASFLKEFLDTYRNVCLLQHICNREKEFFNIIEEKGNKKINKRKTTNLIHVSFSY